MGKKLGMIALTFFFLFSVFSFNRVVYASDIDKKLEQQNKDIENNMNNMPTQGEEFEGVLEQFNSNRENSSGEFNKAELMNKMESSIIKGVIGLRTYSIYMYVLLQFIVVILISTIGSKSLEKRKLYIVFSITITVLFLVFLNLPIIMIYFQNRALEEVIGEGGILKSLIGVISFLKDNSPVISMLLVVYGLINVTLSKNNLPKRMQGKHMIKLAAVVFLVMKILPLIINLIV